MVLKVVRGKILETWELGATNSRFETLSDRQIVKDLDYLTDNLNANTLSRFEG
jgi:hypothetical protein